MRCTLCERPTDPGRTLCASCFDRIGIAQPGKPYPCGTCGFPRRAGAIHHCAPCAGCGVPSRGARIEIDSTAWCVDCYRQLADAGMVGAFDMTNPRAIGFMTTFLLFLQEERGAPISPAPDASTRGQGRQPRRPGVNMLELLKHLRIHVAGAEKDVDSLDL